tara:strand:- start:3021 stop:3443 length:423 start_codon:yes stop_codon:yes gene_type:complete
MIAIIRISGLVKMPKRVEQTLFRLRLRRKYSLVLLPPNPPNLKLIKKIRDYVAYGDIDKETLSLLIEKRAQPLDKDKKLDPKEIIEGLEKKKLPDLGIKPFFRLHPPRGGIDSKKHFSTTNKAVLGDNKTKINDLIRRML